MQPNQIKKKPLDVLIIGMGFSGIGAAIKLLECDIDNIAIYEKSDGIGGTWHENKYPGAACDVPSHLYCYSFAPNPNWSHVYARQAEIKAYLEKIVNNYDLMPYVNFAAEVTDLILDEATGIWDVHFANKDIVKAHHVIHGGGGLHKPSIPKFKGLADFTGEVMHTAQWRDEVDLSGKHVVLIGSAASAIQVIPEVAKNVKTLNIFQRTPNYVIPRGDRKYTAKEQQCFARFPWLLKLYRWFIYMRMELIAFPIVKKNSRIGANAAKRINTYMQDSIKDVRLHDKLKPQYALGCKRILLSDDLYPAINKDNVNLISTPIKKIQPNYIIDEADNNYPADIIVMATGFDIGKQFYSINMLGKNGISLREVWSDNETAYKGCSISGFPNFHMVTGPNTGAGTISHVHIIEQELNYIVKLIKLAGAKKYIEVKQEVQQEYNVDVQAKLNNSVWSSGCSSWYLNDNGINNTLYPEHGRSFKKLLSQVRLEDYRLDTKPKAPN